MNVDFISTRSRISADDIALIDPLKERKWTYSEVNNRAINLAKFLLEQGVEKGDRVDLFSPNDIAYFDLLFACTKIGAYLVPINWRLKPIEISKILEDCRPSIIFYANNHYDRLDGLFPIEKMIDIDSPIYDEICETNTDTKLPKIKVDKSSPIIIMYTSGSTGRPKGVLITHNGIIQNALNAISSWNFSNTDSTLASAPLFHIAGFAGMAIPFLVNGGSVIIERYFSPTISMDYIRDYKITYLFMVPTMYYTIITHEDFDEEIFQHVKLVSSDGAPPSEFVRKRFEQMGKTVINSYGLTEVGPNNFRILPEEVIGREQSIGKPIMFVEAIIVDSDYNEVEYGEIGELLLSSHHICAGYWENSAETEKAFYGNYFCTGDLARKDKDGFFYIANRKKELIITGGENVLPSEVESVLNKHEFVKDSVVVGFNNPEFGESVGAMVILDVDYDDTIEDTLKKYCVEHLAGYKTPKHYIFVDDFPKNAIGKIDKLSIVSEIEDDIKRKASIN